jgi:hypothetical protein
MIKRRHFAISMLAATLLLFACAGEKMDLELRATLDGRPAAGATVTVDGVDAGETGADGVFAKTLRKKPGAEVEITVAKDMPGYKIKPWKNIFLMKLPKKGAVDKYAFEARLEATRFITLSATENGAPVPDAVVKAGGKEVGRTDARGEFVYEYKELPATGVDLTVGKTGYAAWRKTGSVEPGQRLEAALSKRVVVSVTALIEEYGQTSGVPGLSVTVDGKEAGKTDSKGSFTYGYDGEPGRKVQIALSAPGYIPSSWKTSVVLEGEVNIQRYFYPTTPKPIRTGVFRFVGNTPNADLKDVLLQTEEAVAAQLFKYSCFSEVPSKTLQAEVKRSKLSIDKLTAKGWRETPLRRTVDMIVLGSVAKDDRGLLIETKFYASGGKLIHSQLARARGEKDLNSAAKDIVSAVLAKFPFEGTVIAAEDDRYRINLGKAGYKISKGMEFSLMAPRMDESGKVSGFREIGLLRVKKVDDNSSWSEAEDIRKGEKVAVGQRAVRHVSRDDEEGKNAFILAAKGGLPPDVSPLSGVNIYLNEEWIGSTGADGRAEVPVRLGRKYDVVLYRHGYQQVSDKVRIEKNRDVREFTLTVNNAIFKIDSTPSGADVYVNGEKIGRTPIFDGRPVTLGFHTVQVSLGGDYRNWEEVVEFASKVEDRTGSRSIVLHKDYLKIGERAEQKGDIDAAVLAYQSAGKDHPDYSEAHHRLAQIYLDEKGDYDQAILEFENVLSLPENQQLIHKQFAVAFTNLGHAYYEKGNALVQRDKEAAARNFATAVQKLQIAKQNTRFFPNLHYHEAVHDTYYYTALAYHKLYLITKKPALLNDANLAWQEYMDFFPKKLEGESSFEQNRESAQKYWDQIKSLL